MAETPAWKDDFPISWVDDHFVTRREFTKSLVLVSCAAFCANGTLAAVNAIERSRSAEPVDPRPIGSVGEIPIGGAKVFEFPGPGEQCLLVRLDADRFAAFGQKCTHLGCPVLYEKEARQLYCPCHEGRFSAEDGAVISGPPPRPLPRVEIQKKGDELWAMGFRK